MNEKTRNNTENAIDESHPKHEFFPREISIRFDLADYNRIAAQTAKAKETVMSKRVPKYTPLWVWLALIGFFALWAILGYATGILRDTNAPEAQANRVQIDTISTRDLPAEVVRVVDGDTYDLRIHVWEDIVLEKRIRLLGVDTPELRPRSGSDFEREAEKVRAKAATEFVRSTFDGAEIIRFQYAWDSDNFGRALGTVLVDGCDIRDLLRDAGHLKGSDSV